MSVFPWSDVAVRRQLRLLFACVVRKSSRPHSVPILRSPIDLLWSRIIKFPIWVLLIESWKQSELFPGARSAQDHVALFTVIQDLLETLLEAGNFYWCVGSGVLNERDIWLDWVF